MAFSQSTNHEVYGSFFIGESEFALSVKYVQEVVNPPPTYSHLPLSPDYLIGLFNLRGAIIPVVDLRSILKIIQTTESPDPKIAIVELNGCRIGLLFDNTGEIFKSQASEKHDFEDQTAHNLIHGVFKRDEGKRILQILNVQAILKLEHLPQQSEASRQLQSGQAHLKKGQRKQCISFTVGLSKCALGINEIQEILKVDKINQSVLAGQYCIGTINLRGTTVPVVDFATFLGYQKKSPGVNLDNDSQRIIVMKTEKEFFGLLVDCVESIVSYFHDDLLAFPAIHNRRADMFIGCIVLDGRSEILLLNHQNILTAEEITSMTYGHSNLYAVNTDDKKNKNKNSTRKTYISFAVEKIFAVAIDEVKEVIECPTDMMHPPGMPEYFIGVLNLRGALVSIIDARIMYSLPARSDFSIGKVMIFKKNDVHFGLVVDSVEAIVSIAENDKVNIPEMMYKNNSKGLSTDVCEAVTINLKDNQKMSLLVINVGSISERISNATAA